DLFIASFCRGGDGHYELQKSSKGVGYYSVTGRPRLLWVGTETRGGGFVVFPDEGRPFNTLSDRKATVAVDFGTFRTAVVVNALEKAALNETARDTKIGGFKARSLEIVSQRGGTVTIWQGRGRILPDLD